MPAPDPTTVYHVFCLFKMGHEVVDTTDLVEVDRTKADIVFDGIIRLYVTSLSWCVPHVVICQCPVLH